jgi:hypothetical protein
MTERQQRQPVLDALAELPPSSWMLVLSAARGVSRALGDVVMDDPSPEYTFAMAVDAEFVRLKVEAPA